WPSCSSGTCASAGRSGSTWWFAMTARRQKRAFRRRPDPDRSGPENHIQFAPVFFGKRVLVPERIEQPDDRTGQPAAGCFGVPAKDLDGLLDGRFHFSSAQ